MTLRPITLGSILLVGGMFPTGCQNPVSTTRPAADAVHSDEVLAACAQRYRTARTIVLSGVLYDRRNNVSRERRVFLVAQRPDRCRIEVDNNVTVVVGQGVWTYRGHDDRFAQSRNLASVPALAAADAACEGVRLLSFDLFLRGESAFARPPATSRFRLVGHDFSGKRPCYQFLRTLPGKEGRLRVWIDQDSDTVRRWRIEPDGSGNEPRDDECPVVMVIDDVQFDRPVAGTVFHISRPAPPAVAR